MRGCVMIGQRIPCHCDATCTIHDARCGKRVGAHRAGLIAMGAITLTIRESDLLFRHGSAHLSADGRSAPQHSGTVAVARHCLSRARTRSRRAQRHHSTRIKHRLCAALPPSRPPAAMHGCTHAQLTVPCSSDSGITRTRSRSCIEGVGFQVHGHERRWLHGPCRVAQGHRAAASRGVLTDCEYPAPSDVPNHMLASPVGVGDGGGFGESRCRRGSG